MSKKEIKSFCPKDKEEWRQWLKENHKVEDAVWLISYKKSSPNHNLSWGEAVDAALCYGWIDSVKKTIDNERYQQYYSKRKATSTWSRVNKQKVAQFEKEGLLSAAAHKTIEVAKMNGMWTMLDAVEDLIIPEDLERAFEKHPTSKDYFIALSKSMKKQLLLYWVVSAKREETRSNRIEEIASKAAQGQKPKQF
jgi:uncharacterized protein YdeI (YjbR/CyaY-like superfamily)